MEPQNAFAAFQKLNMKFLLRSQNTLIIIYIRVCGSFDHDSATCEAAQIAYAFYYGRVIHMINNNINNNSNRSYTFFFCFLINQVDHTLFPL